MIFETVLIATVFALHNWHFADVGDMRWTNWVIDGVIATTLILNGYYWDIFPRGEGIFTANSLSATALFASCILGPALYKSVHWHLVGHKQWLEEARKKYDIAD